MMPTDPITYVEPAPHGGWRIAGSRISLDSIVLAYREGRLPETMQADFPGLTLEQIHGTIAYYLRHRAEVDRYLAEQEAHRGRFEQESRARNADLIEVVRARVVSPPVGET